MRSALVGRDRELGLLLGCLDEAQSGDASLVVCVGEPGIGKSRLAEELTRAGQARGFRTAWGRAAPSIGAPPYWPWLEVLHALADAVPGSADDAATLTSAAGTELSLDERMRRFDAVSRLVLRVARTQPLIIILDDLDGADETSQLLATHLARIAREDPLLLVVTCRDTAGPLAGLAQESLATQLQVRGLDRVTVGRQVSSIVGREPSDAEIGTVYDATAGNPFFVGELARQMVDGSGWSDVVPRSVLDAIAQRLARLTPDCAASLRAAAVLGTEFTAPVLASVTERSVEDCLLSLDEAGRAALLVPSDTPGVRRFAHDLVRDAIVANLDAKLRVTLHRRAAEALEKHHTGDLKPVLFDLARHWAEAAVAGDQARAVSWIDRAGREAMRQHAYEDGRRLFVSALTVGGQTLDDLTRCRLRLSLAAAQSLSSDLVGALQTCREVADQGVRLGRPDIAGEAALVPEPTFDPEVDQVIRALCEQALSVLGDAPTSLRARVLAQYAVVCDHLSDLDAAHPAVEEALAVAQGSGDTIAVEAALIAHHLVSRGRMGSPSGRSTRTGCGSWAPASAVRPSA